MKVVGAPAGTWQGLVAEQRRERESATGVRVSSGREAEVSLWQAVGWRGIRDKDAELEEKNNKKQKIKLE